jgi:hypothetical protein
VTEESRQQAHPYREVGPIPWWSWRPGIRPRNALVIGALISLVALLLAAIGVVTLVLGILDSSAPPLRVTGHVYSHTLNRLDGQPYLTIRVRAAGFPALVTSSASQVLYHGLQDGDRVVLDYSAHLHVLYALESGGMRYTLPGGSVALAFVGSLSLLLMGVILLPYPALLLTWGWRDLLATRQGATPHSLSGAVVALRASVPARRGRTGLVPRAARPWYGVAVHSAAGDIATFALSQERYSSLRAGDCVRVTYSPHIHFVYVLEQLSAEDRAPSIYNCGAPETYKQ